MTLRKRRLKCVGLFFSLAQASFGQPAPSFEFADAHKSPPGETPYLRGGFFRGGRFEVRSAEMLDLISMAYGVEFGNVRGAARVNVFETPRSIIY